MTQWLVLYCLFNSDKTGHILSLLKEEYFSDILAREIFNYSCELSQKGMDPDISLILSKFGEVRQLNVDADVELYEKYIEDLRAQYAQIKIKQLGQQIVSKKEINEEDFIDYVNTLITSISVCSNDGLHDSSETIDELLPKLYVEEEERSKITYGIELVDRNTAGIFPGQYIIVAGRPSMGKTSIMCHLATHNTIKGNNVVFFSLEMNHTQLMIRMLANESDLEIWKLMRLSSRPEEEKIRVQAAASRLKKGKLFIEEQAFTINSIKSTLEKIRMQHGDIDLVIIDYLQLMTGKGENEHIRIGNVSRQLKQLSAQFNCGVVAGSQLSRTVESRENKRPLLSDLRESGGLEADADLVYFIYRDSYYTKNPEHERIMEFICSKYRTGETGKFLLDYDKKKQTIKSIQPHTKLGQIADRFKYE